MIGRLAIALLLIAASPALAGQAPSGAAASDVPVSHRDRVYTSDQFSNTVSVIDPAENRLLGVIRLGDATPGNLSPLLRRCLRRIDELRDEFVAALEGGAVHRLELGRREGMRRW